MLVLSRKAGESLFIGDNIEIKISEISGDKVKLAISAPQDIKIMRSELCQTIEANKQAAVQVERSALRSFLKSQEGK